MAVTLFSSGSPTLVVGSAMTIDVNETGVFDLVVDPVNLISGDVLEARVYKMTVASGTRRVIFFDAFYGAQPVFDIIKLTEPVSNALTDSGALRFELLQTFGTGRTVPWAIEKHN